MSFFGNIAKYGGFGLIGRKIWDRSNANKQLGDVLKQDPTYQENPYAAEKLGMARQLYNGRMAGAAQEEQNIANAQANTIAAINRGATDSSQALALAGAAQGQANESYNQLGVQEAKNKYNLLDNLNSAYGTMIGEGDKKYQDTIRRFEDLTQIKGAQSANNSALTSDISNLLFGALNLGLSGGFGKKK